VNSSVVQAAMTTHSLHQLLTMDVRYVFNHQLIIWAHDCTKSASKGMLASTQVTKSEEMKVAEEHKLSKALDRKGFTITKQLELCKKTFFSWFSIDPILDIITSEE
jgi:hypothetical protein